jgi:hypothetical protein
MLKLYDCDIGLEIRGTNYEFEHVDSVTHEDPRRHRLTRGANAKNKAGIVYTEGNKEAHVLTTSVIAIPAALHVLLKDVFAKKERIKFYCVSRVNGSSKYANQAILSQPPFQPSVDESAESMNTPIVIESFDVEDDIKDNE